jgi:hypothetical protein
LAGTASEVALHGRCARNGSIGQRRAPTMADVEPAPAGAPAIETAPAD